MLLHWSLVGHENTLKDERYVVIKADMFTVLESFFVLKYIVCPPVTSVHAILTYRVYQLCI